jgi:hypothetical protein
MELWDVAAPKSAGSTTNNETAFLTEFTPCPKKEDIDRFEKNNLEISMGAKLRYRLKSENLAKISSSLSNNKMIEKITKEKMENKKANFFFPNGLLNKNAINKTKTKTKPVLDKLIIKLKKTNKNECVLKPLKYSYKK